MGKLVVMIVLGAAQRLQQRARAGNGADVSVDDTRSGSATGIAEATVPSAHRDRPRRGAADRWVPGDNKSAAPWSGFFCETGVRLFFFLALAFRQVGDGAFEHFGSQTHGLVQSRVSMDGQRDVFSVGTHRWPDRFHPVVHRRWYPPMAPLMTRPLRLSKISLSCRRSSRTRWRDRMPTGRWRLRSSDPVAWLLGQDPPRPSWLGIGDGRDHFRVEVVLLPAMTSKPPRGLRVHPLGQHGLTDDVADGVDVGHVGTQLLVDFDETALVDGNTGLLGIQHLPFGTRPTATSTLS